jgi:molybdate transport system substrate-binding protein
MRRELARFALDLRRAVRALRHSERRFRFSPKSSAPRARSTAVHRIFSVAFAFAVLLASPAAAQETLTVFAAASMKNALDDVSTAFTKATGIKVTASYAASSALAKQIENGAPADVFVSADLKWMDYAAEKKLIMPETRVNLLGNRLVLIAGKDTKLGNVQIGQVEIGPGFDIGRLAGDGRIAVADTKAVPAGLYAKEALEKLGAWTAAAPKLAQSENVRATLAYVARGEAPIGIVYETDAKAEPKVKIIGTFPEGSHQAVTYPVAATTNAKGNAAKYLSFLRTAAAKAMFEKHGFTYLIETVS